MAIPRVIPRSAAYPDRPAVDQVLPPPRLLVLGLQHVLIMYTGCVTVPLVFGAAVGLDTATIALLVNADLLVAGLITVGAEPGCRQGPGRAAPRRRRRDVRVGQPHGAHCRQLRPARRLRVDDRRRHLPSWAQIVVGSAITSTVLTAFCLNLLFNHLPWGRPTVPPRGGEVVIEGASAVSSAAAGAGRSSHSAP